MSYDKRKIKIGGKIVNADVKAIKYTYNPDKHEAWTFISEMPREFKVDVLLIA